MRNIALATLLSLVALFSTEKSANASGDVVFCNQSKDDMYVSFAAQWNLRILTNKWWLAGRYIIEPNKCEVMWPNNSSRFHIYVGVKKKTIFGGFKEYKPNARTSHNFGEYRSIRLCTRDGSFQFTDTLDNLSICSGDYSLQEFHIYLPIPAQPLDQHEDKVTILW